MKHSTLNIQRSTPKADPTCVYKVWRDGDEGQTECGAPATHRAAKNPQLFLCTMHAQEVGKRFKVTPLDAARTAQRAVPTNEENAHNAHIKTS